MPNVDIHLESPAYDSFRVQQVAGMFDLGLALATSRRIRAQLPDPHEPWQLGVIVGPSGSGKSTLARHAFANSLYQRQPWPADRAVIDCFDDLPIKVITRTLTAVGFSTPPAWLRPYHILSTGEQFRCDLAAALLGPHCGTAAPSIIVVDEFTSVVDRTVAKISSCAISKSIRRGYIPKRFVAVTCHYDIIPWLAPDWVLDMSTGLLSRRRLRRPRIKLHIDRADRSVWNSFSRHHYLNHDLHRSSICFVARVAGTPAAFTAVLPFPHPKRPGWREHRTVCLPDFQGVGIGTAISDFVASLFAATGKPYFSRTSHPAMIAHRLHSPHWKLLRNVGMVSRSGLTSRDKTEMAHTISRGRNTAGFEYVGPARSDASDRFGLHLSRARKTAHL
jgi:hypothetical protein